MTTAQPIAPGETWRAEVEEIDLAAVSLQTLG
jgi:hypothetical protein